MEEKIMTLELSAEDPASGRYYYVSLELPVEGYEILDALQKIRVYDRDVYIEQMFTNVKFYRNCVNAVWILRPLTN